MTLPFYSLNEYNYTQVFKFLSLTSTGVRVFGAENKQVTTKRVLPFCCQQRRRLLEEGATLVPLQLEQQSRQAFDKPPDVGAL